MATALHNLLYLFILLLLIPTTSSYMNQTDLNALISIKNSLTQVSLSPLNHFFSTWNLTAPDPCSSFSGVTCVLHRVTILSLGTDSLQLAGSLSDSISSLTHLTQLILSPGIVTGPIPPKLAQLTKLRVISLPWNRLTGIIPSELSSLRSLHTVDLSHNLLTGSVPAPLTELPQLKVLILASNYLTHTLPSTLSSPLLHLDLKDNRLTGPLPFSLPSSLRYLSLSNNLMWGPIPNGLQTLTQLQFLDLSINRFTGPIPPQLFSLPALSNIFLQRNNFSGGIGPGPSKPNYSPRSIVDLSHNALSGELSTVFHGVDSLYLNNNRFVGRVPQEYLNSVCRGTTTTLYLQHNYLTGITLQEGSMVPDTASLCFSYNCMVPPPTITMTCPPNAAADTARPDAQCSVFYHRS